MEEITVLIKRMLSTKNKTIEFFSFFVVLFSFNFIHSFYFERLLAINTDRDVTPDSIVEGSLL